jgi:hypothetical protein
MTATEFNNEFDVIYYSAASNGAAPLDDYEKSVFLTQAQEEIIKNYYNPKGNKYQEGFEATEKRRNDLGAIVHTATSVPFTDTTAQISNRSLFFGLPNDLWLIAYERLKVVSADPCLNNKTVDVVPVTLDEYSLLINNPFKKPSKKIAFRLNLNNVLGTLRRVEIVHGESYTPTEYYFRYLKKPNPIIVANLPIGLSIDNITTQSDCELNPIVHREILNRAVELALESTGNPRVQSKVQLNQRNE